MPQRSLILAALGTLGLVAAAPAVASAAAVTVTGDDGNPVALSAGAPVTIRNMSPSVAVAFPPGDGRFALAVTDGAGIAASSGTTCLSDRYASSDSVGYRGNGPYTVTVTNYGADDYSCKTPLSQEAYQFVIAASVGLTQPAKRFLLRAPNSFSSNPVMLPVGLNPGASSYELRYAAGGVVGPDGSISGPSAQAFVDTTTGLARLSPTAPGTYTVVARASDFSGGGEFFTPWSAPVKVTVVAPFDLTGVTFPDARGPSYRIRGEIREKSARGRVSIALAKGTKRGRYHSLGSARISSKGTFSKRFRTRRTGTYRLRFSFKGSATVQRGRVVQRVRFTKRIFFG
jgi:hypothetical protein